MNLKGQFVLPEGTLLEPVADLPEEMQHQITAEPGDYALSRRNSRSYSKVLEPEAAALIREFETPCTIVKAIARFSVSNKLDAERVLVDSLPLLGSLVEAGLLVAAGSPESVAVAPSAEIGSSIEGWTIVGAIQAFEDCEVYQVRSFDGLFAAMKIARRGVDSAALAIARESAVLASLGGVFTPRVLMTGAWEQRAFVVLEWLEGSEAHVVCGELRKSGEPTARGALAAIAGNILAAYADLHERGVVHGDVHPRNVLVDRHYRVKLIDFGIARLPNAADDGSRAPRGGVSFYLDPESAKAALTPAPPPPASVAGEQYAVAAMLYYLVAGSHYLDFIFEKRAMLRQIAYDKMMPFARHSIAAWPDAESVLARALEKLPQNRFPSMADFAGAWQSVAIESSFVDGGDIKGKRANLHFDIITAAAIGGALMRAGMDAPTTSVAYGSAGLAYGLHRLACVRSDGELLALADAWCERSLRTSSQDSAFWSDELEVTGEWVGPQSLHHGLLGVYVVAALTASARSDSRTQDLALDRFLELARQPARFLDLAGGVAGALLGCALLWDTEPARRPDLSEAASGLLRLLQEKFAEDRPIGYSSELPYLGIAHGWAGLLYAAITWLIASGQESPDALVSRLEELAACGRPTGRGLQWNRRASASTGDHAFAASWCNGSAGYVFLWTQAYRVTRDSHFLELAEGAAWHTWEVSTPNPNLCCGMAGRAYALLNFDRTSGDVSWLRRAEGIMEDAAAVVDLPDGKNLRGEWRIGSLYKGDVALALLATDLLRPEDARMPLFELEA